MRLILKDVDHQKRIGVACIVKNEACYLPEWVAHYHLMGFDKIILCNDHSTDGTQEIIDHLASLGIVEPLKITARRPDPEGEIDGVYKFSEYPQGEAYNKSLQKYKSALDYLCLFDADEYLFSDPYTTPKEQIIKLFNDADVSGIGVNWVMFGSNGHKHKTDGLVMERFTAHSSLRRKENKHYKSIVRLSACDSMFNPHHPNLTGGKFVHGDGNTITFATRRKDGKRICRRGLSSRAVWHPLRLHHYFTKSEDEFRAKMARGLADSKDLRTINDFYAHDFGEEHVFAPAHTHLEAIKGLVGRWGFSAGRNAYGASHSRLDASNASSAINKTL